MRKRNILLRLTAALALGTVTGCSVAMPQPIAERLNLEFDGRTWVVAYEDPQGDDTLIQYVPQGSTAAAWTEMITQRSFYGLQKTNTADTEMQNARQSAQEQCSKVDWSVVGQEPGSVRYIASISGCKESRPLHEVGRFIMSPEAIYVITYQSKKPTMTDAEKQAWADTLARASYQDVVIQE